MNDSMRNLPDLLEELKRLLAQVPPGRVTTYGSLAAALGDRIAARWVGQVLLHDERVIDRPTHRVVRAGGELGQFPGGDVALKERLLKDEGVAVTDQRVDLEQHGFAEFESSRPLAQLRQQQEALRERLVLPSGSGGSAGVSDTISLVAGVDVSYQGDEAVAAYALIELGQGRAEASEPVWSHVVRQRVTFPYISSYLAFRELPVLLTLLKEVASQSPLADIILVDGSGILHPRRMGIASMLGVLSGQPTIGVTKKRLIGREESTAEEGSPVELPAAAPMVHEQEQLGWAVWPRSGTRRPLYVSPGHLIDLATSRDIVLRSLGERRLPEPIYWADRLSRAAARSK